MYLATNSNVNIGNTVWQLKILTITCLKHVPQDCCQRYKDATNTRWHWKINKACNTDTWEIVGSKHYTGALKWETVRAFPKLLLFLEGCIKTVCAFIHAWLDDFTHPMPLGKDPPLPYQQIDRFACILHVTHPLFPYSPTISHIYSDS